VTRVPSSPPQHTLHTPPDPRADGLGVSTCIELALKDAGIDREQVNYINAHATR
jgi:3-oxoacyl-[acyl-carrier-protein] synthase II